MLLLQHINIRALYFHYNLNITQNACLLSLALEALLIFGHPVLPKKKTPHIQILLKVIKEEPVLQVGEYQQENTT